MSKALRAGPSGRPTRAEVEAAVGKRLADVIAPGLDVLFCGINPGLYSAAVGRHFARPGNRFWRVLHTAGFTHRLLEPGESHLLLTHRLGLTDLVARATRGADELGASELRRGRGRLERKAIRFRPRWIAVLGLGAYRTAFGDPGAEAGPQSSRFGPAGLWVLPNPSGLNAGYSFSALVKHFRALRRAAHAPD